MRPDLAPGAEARLEPRLETPLERHARPSPNHNARPSGVRPTAIILHADASASAAASLAWCARPESRVSYHTLVGRTGVVYDLVAPARRAWHAGTSTLEGVADCNDFALGLCAANRNDGVEPYPPAQLAALVAVAADWCRTFGIPVARITTHAAVATPPGRKTDPGPRFDVAAFCAAVARALESASVAARAPSSAPRSPHPSAEAPRT